jgi:hypothetical protein
MQVWGRYLIFVILIGSRQLKNFRNQRTAGSVYLIQTFKTANISNIDFYNISNPKLLVP